MHGVKLFTGAAVSVLLMALAGPTPALADTIEAALVRAYQNNPQLNAQRAQVRVTDENVPTALSGYRPRVSATASGGVQYTDTTSRTRTPTATTFSAAHGTLAPRSVGATATQTLFNGLQTTNRVRQAESQVSGAREVLRLTEQQVLLAAVTAYMNLLRDSAVLDLQKRNVEVLSEQLRQTRDRFNVGEVTRTDVAQAESRVAAGRSAQHSAESNYITSRATFRQVIGVEAARLTSAMPVDRYSPDNIGVAVEQGKAQHPQVAAAMLGVDVASLQVRINEGALFPTVTLQGNVQRSYEQSNALFRQFSASALTQVTIPLYQGGAEYSAIRQSKETLGQRRIDVDTARDQVQATVVQSWGQVEAAKAQIIATQAQVNAAEIALNGVTEEARVGQRTTLDVLNAQQELVNARVALVSAQRDRVVASYTLLSAVGRLSAGVLGLKVPSYDPIVHYEQVRDSWVGVRNPDGR
ncbi:MAG: TolC family outer membrane protein [Proteobacteria bacterium]|nr:TolC family outer membrane protein [Pseudomonadota bacterium]